MNAQVWEQDVPKTLRTRRGFTLIELLVVIAIIAILAGMLLPALSKAKSRTQGVQCMNNGHQVIYAWTMYAHDNNNVLPGNQDNGNYAHWLGGDVSAGNPQGQTNWGVLINKWQPPGFSKAQLPSQIGNYIINWKVCQCPSDPTVPYPGKPSSDFPPGAINKRARNFSMNQAVGTKDGSKAPVDGPWLTGSYGQNTAARGPFYTYGRLDSFLVPGPGDTFVNLDEDPGSINDSAFATDCQAYQMVDWPATYHDFAAGFAFADGHSVIHKWLDKRTQLTSADVTSQPGSPDLLWMAQHSSAYRSGKPVQ